MNKNQGGPHNLEDINIVKETNLDAKGEGISWDEVWLMVGSVISMRNHGNVGRRNCQIWSINSCIKLHKQERCLYYHIAGKERYRCKRKRVAFPLEQSGLKWPKKKCFTVNHSTKWREIFNIDKIHQRQRILERRHERSISEYWNVSQW